MSFKNSNRLKMVAFLLASSVSAVAFAQMSSGSVGMVRISDGRIGSNGRSSGPLQQVSACENGAPCQYGSVNPNAGAGAGAGTGNCPPGGVNGVCPTGNGCPTGQCRPCRHCLLGCCQEHYCKHSPDYGYSPPAKYPLQRRGVEYTSYFPNQWYGAGADYSQVRYPMVYQPTDTTQMGFYYQHVPTWQPMAGRVPERPIPSQWHIVAPPVSPSNFCHNCYPGSPLYYGNRCRYRAYHHWGLGGRSYDVTEWCPTDASSSSSNGQASPQPATPVQPPAGGTGVVPTPVEPETPSPLPQGGDGSEMDETPGNAPNALQRVPAQPDSASSGHIRRLGFTN